MKVRNKGIDQVKAYASLMVVLAHALNDNYTVQNYASIDKLSRFFNTFFNILSSTGVPLFLIAAGYYLYNRERKFKEILLKNILALWFPYAVWVVVNRPLNSYSILEDSLAIFQEIFLMKSPWPHYLWYIPAVFGIYLMSPLIQKFLVALDRKDFNYLFVIVLIITSSDYYNLLLRIREWPHIALNIGINISAIILFLYPMYGYYFKNYSEKEKINHKSDQLLLLTIFIFLLIPQFKLLNNQIGHRVYNYPLGIILSLLTFKVIYHLKVPTIFEPYLRFISINSLSYYFAHRFILYNLNKHFYFVNRPINTILSFILTIILVRILIFIYKLIQGLFKNRKVIS